MKKIKKYFVGLGLIFVIVFTIFSISIKTSAAVQYFYWYGTETTKTELGDAATNTGFNSLAKCEEALKKVGAGWLKSANCYTGENIKINSISPSEGKPGDLITISGSGFNSVTNISFNGTKASSPISNTQTEIKVLIPSGATTGVITVTTQYRGTAKSSSFNVLTEGLRWWFYNVEGQIMGPGLEETTGIDSEENCITARTNYIKSRDSITATVKNCFQASVSFAKEQIDTYQKQGADFIKEQTGQEDEPIAVVGKINEVENKSIYNFLAPIGKIKCMDTTGQDPNCISNNIGTYLNFIFKLGIGVCAALAVIMLIISGISYMGDESVFGKTEAKGKMFSAILGLLIAIGAWALLNTINPDLTGSKGLSIAQANIEVENESAPWVKYEKSDGKPVTGCSEGFTDVPSGNGNPIHVCKSIATNLAKLIADAKDDGIILSGGGFRSKAEQMSLRAKNCQPPTRTQQELESGNISCRVATAIPGNSNHEKGLAVDFTCNGSSMGKTDTNNVCYKWLVANASKYGLYNKYATLQETWHWSVSGT